MLRTVASLVAAFFLVGFLRATPAASASPPQRRDSGVHPVRATLPNGLQIVVLPDALAPVVTTWLNVEAGSDDEPYEGLAHAQEHMFYRGSKTLGGTQADIIAGFTGDEDNADTQAVITQYFHTMPAQDLGVAIRLDASRFTGILDAEHDWREERGAIEQEVTRDNSDAAFRLGVRLQHHLMAGTPYADDGLGTLHSFDRQIEAPQLQRFYDTWYRPNNAIYVIAGNVDPATAIATVRRSFAAIPAKPLPPRPAIVLAPLRPALYTDTSDQPTTTALVAYRYPGFASADYAASVVLADILNNPRGDLYGLVAGGKAISIEADPNPFPRAGFITIVSHVSVTTVPRKAIDDVEATLARYRKNGVPANLIEAAKRHEIAQGATVANSIRGLAGAWSEALAAEHRTPQDDIDAIVAVKPADVDRVVATYLVNATANVAYAVPKAAKDAATTGGGESNAGESAKPAPARLAPLPAWAERALRATRAPQQTVRPTMLRLANGLRLIVAPERTSASVVVQGSILHDPGLEEPVGEAGVGDVVEALLPFGTRTYSRVAYQSQLDAIAATVHAGFSFSLATLASHFDRGMALLADDELHPAFAKHDFEVVRAQRSDELSGEATSPDHLAAVATAERLYPQGDPGRHFSSPADVEKLTLPEAVAFHRGAFRPELTTIVIVGDVTVPQARRVAERWFGGWKNVGPTPRIAPPVVADNRPASTTIPATGRVQDTVHLRETLPLASADPDVAALLVANTVLSGDFSSLLLRDMRVTTGYVYSVGTALPLGRTRSTFDVQYACSPQNFSKAQRVLVRDLHRLQTTPLDAERLQRAKAHLVSSIALVEESYAGLASSLLANAMLGLPLDTDLARARAELAVTPRDVRVAMSRWVRPDGFVRVVEGPTPQ